MERPPDVDAQRRLYWFLAVRLVLVLFSLGAILLLEGDFILIPPTMIYPYVLTVGALVVNVVSFMWVRFVGPSRGFALVHVILDTLLVWALIYLTGVLSFFSYFFFAIVFAGAFLVRPRMGIFFASLATILLVSTHLIYVFAQENHWVLPFVVQDDPMTELLQWKFLVPYFVVFGGSLHIVGISAWRIAVGISRDQIVNDEILNTIPAGVLTVTADGEIAYVNPIAEQMLGKSADSLLQKPISEVLPASISSRLMRMTSGLDSEHEAEIIVGEDQRTLQVTHSRIRDVSGRLRGAVCILDDISDKRRMEEVSKQTDRFRALIEMSASMAHEIRNPLASIRGAVQELKDVAEVDEDDRLLLDIVMRESDRLNKIISRFLEFAGDSEQTKVRCNLSSLLEDVALLMSKREGSDVTVREEIQKGLIAFGSPDGLKQVFLNVGLNAMDASPEKGEVIVRAYPMESTEEDSILGGMGRWIAVEFEDSGPGIPNTDRQRIFDPFFTRKESGTGMGLAIARKIIDFHGGQIEILSGADGKGTLFRLLVPKAGRAGSV
jgi:two-component system sensor histidine kinase PilS (NtrC family)